jgi:hypothetical protein
MHLGHFRGHVESRIAQSNPGASGFFNPKSWREFMHSAVAARLMAMPPSVREPCCDLRMIGGDGTSIGVPVANVDTVEPVWKPPCGIRLPVHSWGRLDRCVIQEQETNTASDAKAARHYVKECTDSSVTRDVIRELRDSLDTYADTLPKEVSKVLEIWFSIDSEDPRWDPIRRLVRMCSYEDSILGILPVEMLPHVKQFIDVVANCQHPPLATWNGECASKLMEMKNMGMGPEIIAAVECCLGDTAIQSTCNTRAYLVALASFLQLLGKILYF